eukprot:2133772-Rhodomonas_salina.1
MRGLERASLLRARPARPAFSLAAIPSGLGLRLERMSEREEGKDHALADAMGFVRRESEPQAGGRVGSERPRHQGPFEAQRSRAPMYIWWAPRSNTARTTRLWQQGRRLWLL